MAFRQTLSACLRDGCSKLVVTDTTGVYDATNNPYGWGDASTLLEADVDSATITITYTDSDGNDSEIDSIDVTSQIPADVTDSFEFDVIEGDFEDGYYTITYTITAGTATYTKSFRVFFYCTVKCCIDKLAASIADKICDCDFDEYVNDIFIAEMTYAGMQANASCGNITTMYKLLERLQRICSYENCDC